MKLAEKAFFGAGVLLFAWLLYRIGLDALARNLAAVGWGFLLVLALQTVTIALNTLAWRRMLPPAHRGVPLRALASMLLSGDAINAVTPAAVVGGELVRVSRLARRVPTAAALGATGLAAMAQFFGQILFILAGLPVAWALTRDPRLRLGLGLLSAALLGLLGGVIYLGWSRQGLARFLRLSDRVGWLRRLWEPRRAFWQELAAETLGSLRSRPGDFFGSVALSFLGWSMGVFETYLILALLRAPVGWLEAAAIEVLSVAIEGALFFVPAKMGTQEAGRYAVFLALGLRPETGFTLGFIKRLRELAWAGVGLSLYGLSGRDPSRREAGSGERVGPGRKWERPPLPGGGGDRP